MEARTLLSLNLNGVHTSVHQGGREKPPHGNLFFWRLELSFRSILFNVSGRLWGGLSLGICSSGGWNSDFFKLKWCSYFSMYQGGCGESSTYESVSLEAETGLS